MSDRLADALLWPLADVSMRWGLLILALAAWFAIRPPRRAATRYTLGLAALLAGPALLLAPRWDAYVYGLRADLKPAPVPDFSAMRPLTPARVREIESRIAVEARPAVATSAAPLAVSTPPPPPVDWPRVAAKAVAAAWLTGSLLMLARLVLGVRALRRWARRATPATADDVTLLDACRAAQPTSRPIGLMRHPAIASPAMVGGRRPIVMLPPDWDAWPADRRRAALLHELSHVRRYDDASKLVEELLRVPAWFHPAVAWLIARIDRERELLCDEAAVAAGDDPKGLARLLLDLSRSPSLGRLPRASLPFLTRRTTAVRIRRLLEDDMTRTLSRPSLVRTLLLGPAALAALLALGTLRVREASAQDAPREILRDDGPFPNRSFQDIVTTLEEAPTGRLLVATDGRPADAKPIEGTIVDPDGNPVAGATVVVESQSGRLTLTTDDAGKYSVPVGTTGVKLYAFKPGYTPASVIGVSAADEESRRTMRLGRPAAFSGVLVDEADRPIVAATLRIGHTESTSPAETDGPMKYQTHSYRFPPEGARGTEIERALTATTGEDGAFVFPEAAEDEAWVKFEITEAGGRRRMLRRPVLKGRGWTREELGFVKVRDGVRRVLVTTGGARIEGRVASRVSGLNLSELSVMIRGNTSPYDPHMASKLDAEGRFAIEGLEIGRADLVVHGEGQWKSWVARPMRQLDLTAGATATAMLEVIPGVEVTGKIVSGKEAQPVAGAAIQIANIGENRRANPFLFLTTEADGRYACRLLPGGKYILAVSNVPAGYDPSQPIRQIETSEGATTVAVPPFDLEDASTISGRVLDADGRPIAGARVALLAVALPPRGERNPVVTDERGTFRLRLAPERGEVGKPVSLRVERLDGKPFRIDASPNAEGVYVVKFAPTPAPDEEKAAAAAKVRESSVQQAAPAEGRVVDAEGRPIAGATVLIGEPLGSDVPPVAVVSDERGVFARRDELKLKTTFLAWKEGYAPTMYMGGPDRYSDAGFTVTLRAASPFAGVLVDESDRPIAGASLRVTAAAHSEANSSIGFRHYRREDVEGTAVDAALTATTADDGSFLLPSAWAEGTGLLISIVGPDGRHRVIPRPGPLPPTMESFGFLAPRPGERPRLAAVLVARIEGRVVSKSAKVDISKFQVASHGVNGSSPTLGYGVLVPTDAEGRFAIEDLQPEQTEVLISGPSPASRGRCERLIRGVKLESGRTTTLLIDMDEGVEVTGVVRSGATGKPLAGVEFWVNGPDWDNGVPTVASDSPTTDAEGRYRAWLLPGVAKVIVIDTPPGHPFRPLSFEVPKGAASFEAPPLELEAAETIPGRIAAPDGGGGDGTHSNAAGPSPPLPTQPIVSIPREAKAAPNANAVFVVKHSESAANVAEKPAVAPIEGTVVDPGGKPIADATVVVDGDGDFGRRSLTTDDTGRFSTPGATGEGSAQILIAKPGYAPVATNRFLEPARHKLVQPPLVVTLSRPAPFAGLLVDAESRPIAGATVRVIRTAVSSDLDGDGTRISTIFFQFPPARTAGTPAEKALIATTAEDGSFTLPEAAPAGYGLRFEIRTADGRPRIVQRPEWDRRDWSLEHQGFIVASPEGRTLVKTIPPARIEGKVVSKVAGVDVSRLRAWYQDSRPNPDKPPVHGNPWVQVAVDAQGRFAFEGLDVGTVNVYVKGEGEAESWTYRAVKDLKLEVGQTSAATIELIEGVEVTGLVKAEGKDRPIAGAEVAVSGPFRPKTGLATASHKTDAEGRYRFRLPAGETELFINSLPEGYLPVNQRPEGHRTVTIPEGARFEVPPLVAVANQGTGEAVEKAAPGR